MNWTHLKTKLLICSICFSTFLFAQKQPNIIVFIADDMGWEESTPYGNNYIRTPNINRLAKEGMRFDNFYLTASSCSPSRVSIMTGMYPHNTGAMNLHSNVSDTTQLLPEPLNDAGYYTMLVGKIHGMNTKVSQAKFQYLDLADWSKPWNMGEKWLTALELRPKDKPFFMWASSIDPHRPFRQGKYPFMHNPDSVFVPPYYPDIPEIRKDLANYYDEIGRFDEHIGKVLQYLEQKNELNNTLIIVLSDNGKAFPQCKTRTNVQGLRSPFIVRYPAIIKKGTVTKSMVSAVDIAPTLLQLAKAKPLQNAQGVSFLPVLKNPTATIREFAYGEHNWHGYMAYERTVISKDYLYTKNWLPELPGTPAPEIVPTPFFQTIQRMYENDSLDAKYADCFVAPRPVEELFYVAKDIHCMNNLYADKNKRSALTKMQTALNDWLRKTGDAFPGKEKLKKDGPDRKKGEANNKEKEG